MAAVPEFIEHGEQLRKEKISLIESKSLDALWGANIVGRKFQLKREKASYTIEERHSPRAHIRKGHFHSYHHGPKNSLIKIKWTLPCWVGLKE